VTVQTPFTAAPPRDLYSVQDLLGGFDPADDMSWTTTVDGSAFAAFVAAGRRSAPLPVARAQAEHDVSVTASLDAALEHSEPVAIMGGHRMLRGDTGYRAVAQIARALAAEGLAILSGGGPGAMEATHLGARFAGHDAATLDAALDELSRDEATRAFPLHRESDLIGRDGTFVAEGVRALHAWQVPAFRMAAQDPAMAGAVGGIGIPTWLYGHEPPTFFAARHAKYYANSVREDGLLAVATFGVIYAPGSAGTLQEIYQDAAQNHYRSAAGVFSPMVFLDTDQIWTARYCVDTAMKSLLPPEQFSVKVTFTDQPADAVGALLDRRELMRHELRDAAAPS
jgi:predicted Rossmann-fold nucleotide-binding protein